MENEANLQRGWIGFPEGSFPPGFLPEFPWDGKGRERRFEIYVYKYTYINPGMK
jgi:hypothetical protein